MNDKPNGQKTCAVCGKAFHRKDLVAAPSVRPAVSAVIGDQHPEWSHESYICRPDLNEFRGQYIDQLLQSERGEVTSIEQEVIKSLRDHELISRDVDVEPRREWTIGERLADKISVFGGSWTFLIIFFAFLAIWMAVNSVVLAAKPPDPYPFILLNLLLSCLAAIQAPIIMMSQRRQEAKDRLRSQHDYQVNLKAELEIRHLHEKVDHLLSHQWERLVAIQGVQLELLAEISKQKK
jgi:uncharacterized membrane protein